MSTAQLVLILAVLLLGGVIATVGDRLGTRIGKARISLFKLRPRKTATLVTILTGTLISASTFGILFALSEELRKGVFEFENNQRRLRRTRGELEEAVQQKRGIEEELVKARSDQKSIQEQLSQAKDRLTDANRSLASANTERESALAEAARIQNELSRTRSQLGETNQSLQSALAERSRAEAAASRVQQELSRTQAQFAGVTRQATQLRSEIAQLQADRNQVIADRDREIKQREERLGQLQARLRDLEGTQSRLASEIKELELTAQLLLRTVREGRFAIQRGQPLASGVVRIVDPAAAKQAIDQLLNQANKRAIELVKHGKSEQIIRIRNTEVDKLIRDIQDGKEYVLLVVAAANYLPGEAQIQVVTDSVENRVVFQQGQVIASSAFSPADLTTEQLQEQLNRLLAASTSRAQTRGILNNSVELGRIQNLASFLEQLKTVQQPVNVVAVAAEPIYTIGPLKLEFIAEANGQILFRSRNFSDAGASR